MGPALDWLEQRAPISCETILYLVVHVSCLLMSFAICSRDLKDRDALMRRRHVSAVLGVAVVAAFSLALLHLIWVLKWPLG